MYSWVQLSHLVHWSGGSLQTPTSKDFPITGISTDTRDVSAGQLFVALKGEKFDGHKFILDAVSRGAVAILSEHTSSASVPVIVVPNTLAALVKIATKMREHFPWPVFAITGSAGKSSTKEMLGCLLGPDTVAAPASFNNLLGVSKTFCLVTSETRQLVLEMGMNAEGEIKEMCTHFRPTAGLITNIGDAHLGKLGEKEGIYPAKKELFDALASRRDHSTRLALNLDDPLVEKAFAESFKDQSVPTVTYSIEKSADVQVLSRRLDPETGSLEVRMKAYDEVLNFKGAIYGLHHAQNLVAAVAGAISLGVELSSIVSRFPGIKPARHRGGILSFPGGGVLIDESYNSNPTALRSSIESLSSLNPSRFKLLVIGDMREMGKFSTEVHRQAGLDIANLLHGQPYCVLAVGKEVGPLVQALKEKAPGVPCRHVADVAAAIESLSSLMKPQSLCIVKGSRGVELDRLVASLVVDPQ